MTWTNGLCEMWNERGKLRSPSKNGDITPKGLVEALRGVMSTHKTRKEVCSTVPVLACDSDRNKVDAIKSNSRGDEE